MVMEKGHSDTQLETGRRIPEPSPVVLVKLRLASAKFEKSFRESEANRPRAPWFTSTLSMVSCLLRDGRHALHAQHKQHTTDQRHAGRQ